ncbi:MAG: 2-C-methyl-D-erythritol 4-phosphate cytidylyltransferase [Bacteroidota bacterium]
MKRIAVIVAGGAGTRMGAELPKQFLLLHNRPILMHTLECFSFADERILVLPENQIVFWKHLIDEYAFELSHRIVAGGKSRFESVQNGLKGINSDAVIAVHDGVRPLATQALIERCFDAAMANGTAIPFVSIPDTVRSRHGDSTRQEDRSNLMAVQTPQCFHSKHIMTAYGVKESDSFTDDASVLENAGIRLFFNGGERWNFKITFQEDLAVAEAILSRRKN